MKHVPKQSTVSAESVRILKRADCPSLSGQSQLTYQLGCTPESQAVLRVFANSAAGYFSKEWVPVQGIQKVFAKLPAGKPITSTSLRSIFHGKSVNSAGFLLAALKQEGVVAAVQDKRRCYALADLDGFLARLEALMAGVPLAQVDVLGPPMDEALGEKAAPIKPASPRGRPKKVLA